MNERSSRLLECFKEQVDYFDMMTTTKIIFEYRLKNAGEYCIGEDDGFSVTLYSDGHLIYRKYKTENIEVKLKKFILPKNTIKQIYNIIRDSNIKEFPKSLYNDSCDGNFNEFIFYNKKVSVLNIINEQYQPELLDKDYLEEYGENYYYECQVINLFNKVVNELLKSGYKLSLYSFGKKLFFIRILIYIFR